MRHYLAGLTILTVNAFAFMPEPARAQTAIYPDFPPLDTSQLYHWVETRNLDAPICQDFLTTVRGAELPRQDQTPVTLGDLGFGHADQLWAWPWQEDGAPKGVHIKETPIGPIVQYEDGPIFLLTESGIGGWRSYDLSRIWMAAPDVDFDQIDPDGFSERRNADGTYLIKDALAVQRDGEREGYGYGALSDWRALGYLSYQDRVSWIQDEGLGTWRVFTEPRYSFTGRQDGSPPQLTEYDPHEALQGRLLCQPEFQLRPDVVLPPSPALDTTLGLLSDIVGRGVPSGQIDSSERQVQRAARHRAQIKSQPWVIGMKRPGKPNGFRQDISVVMNQLEAWSYGGAWRRWKYESFQRALPGAKAELSQIIEAHYGRALPNADELAETALNGLIDKQFVFPGGGQTQIHPDLLKDLLRGEAQMAEVGEALRANLQDAMDETEQNSPRQYAGDAAPLSTYQITTSALFQPSIFRRLLRDYPDAIEARNAFGKTPLMTAAHLNKAAAVDALLAAGAAVDPITHKPAPDGPFYYPKLKPNPRSALDYAIENADVPVILSLWDAGAVFADEGRAGERLWGNPVLPTPAKYALAHGLGITLPAVTDAAEGTEAQPLKAETRRP